MLIRFLLVASFCLPVYADDPDAAAGALNAPLSGALAPVTAVEPALTCPAELITQADPIRARAEKGMANARKVIKQTHQEIAAIRALAEAAQECSPDATVRTCAAAFQLIKRIQLFTRPLMAAFQNEWQVPNNQNSLSRARDFAKKTLAEMVATFDRESITLQALRTNSKSRWNYVKNLSLTYLFQLTAFGTQVWRDSNYNTGVLFPVLINTFIMITLQSNKGTEKTATELDLAVPQTLDELNALIPAMMAGTEGFKSEASNRMAGFLGLWPIEVAFVTLASLLSEAISPYGGAEAFLYNTPARILAVTAASIGIFGTYLAARWSLFDYWFNLRYLPLYQQMNRQNLQRVDQELDALLVQAGIEKPKRRSVTQWATQRFTQEGKRHGEGRARYKEFLKTPEAQALLLQREQLARTLRRGTFVESTYRIGLNFVDCFLIFGLMGDWVPEATDWLMGFATPPPGE